MAKIILAILLIVVAVFCLFGFLATFEPIDRVIAWRIVYGVVAVGAAALAVRLLRTAWSQVSE